MNSEEQNLARFLNYMVTGKNFEDKNLNEYLYASLSQPPIKIVDKNGSDNSLDFTVECPNCKSHVNYGEHIRMISGYLYCDTKGCREEVYKKAGIE